MKTGILTFHRSVNNGAFMQAYALSSEIKKRFPSDEVEIIDFTPPSVVNYYSYSLVSYLRHSTLRVFAGKLLHLLRDPAYLKRMRKRTAVFDVAADALPLSEKKIVSSNDEDVYAYINDNYDRLVVGSDAVWNFV